MASWQAQVTALTLRMAQGAGRRVDFARRPGLWRRRMDRFALRFAHLPDTASLSRIDAGGVPARWVEMPDSRAHRVLLYFHGGHFVYGSAATHQALAARLCAGTESRALVIDYRLAPEHPFPAALEDAVTAYHWLLSSGLTADEIVFAGDAAGGGLAVSALMALRDRGDPLPAGAVLMSPWLDLALTGRSIQTQDGIDPLLTIPLLSCCAHLYLGATAPTAPLASPLYGDCRGLPPLLIQASREEMLRDDAVRFAGRADSVGADVTVDLIPGALHAAPFFGIVPEAKGAVARARRFIDRVIRHEDLALKKRAYG